eukprot:GFKZ01011559.1.p1 GENE.GFKZ01011559.1~~GFKZ01011559.1.p1  ORF type:complete len:665 (-),score=93.70 GFKZ01011559.1:1889-3754(-)
MPPRIRLVASFFSRCLPPHQPRHIPPRRLPPLLHRSIHTTLSIDEATLIPAPRPSPKSRHPIQNPRNAPPPPLFVETSLRIALIGRPNVGKSTLFNRLAASNEHRHSDTRPSESPPVFVHSVVDPAPGVTRDPREAVASLSDLRFSLIDTAGLEDAISSPTSPEQNPHVSCFSARGDKGLDSLVNLTAHSEVPAYRAMYHHMEHGTADAVRQANVIFFVLDAGVGVTEIDRALALWLRKAALGKPVVVVANKCDKADAEKNVVQAYELGFGDPVVVSAEHNLGFVDLYTQVQHAYELRKEGGEARLWEGSEEAREEKDDAWEDELVVGCGERKGEQPLQQLVVSIVGRPNVGKSTLLNRLVGEERSLVGPVAGVTRDALLCEWNLPKGVHTPDGIPVWLVDTAGIRARGRVGIDKLERLSVRSSLNALRRSHVVVVVLDSSNPLCHQDMKLLDVAVTEGRAVVLVVNKMDQLAAEDMAEWRLRLRYDVDHKVSSLKGVEVVEMSAKEWRNGEGQSKRLFHAVQRARERWEKRVTTSSLNRFVARFNERISVGKGFPGEKRNRIGVTKFISQRKIRPPMFRLDGSSAVSLNYLRMLTNAIRQEFGFEGVPIRVKRPSRRKRK